MCIRPVVSQVYFALFMTLVQQIAYLKNVSNECTIRARTGIDKKKTSLAWSLYKIIEEKIPVNF